MNQIQNKLILQHAVGLVAPTVRSALLEDAAFATQAGYRTSRTISFASWPFDIAALSRAVVRLYRASAPVTVRSENGQDARLEIDPADQRIVCIAGPRRFKLAQFTLFAPHAEARLKAFLDVPEYVGLLPVERDRWTKQLAAKPITSVQFLLLLDALKATPVSHALRLQERGDRPISLDEFTPPDPALMRRCVGSYSKSDRRFLDALRFRQQDWIATGDDLALELTLSTVSRADYTFSLGTDETSALALAQRMAAIAPALDPFSRVAALELLISAAAAFPSLIDVTAGVVATHQASLTRLDDDLKVFGGAFLLAQSQLSVGVTREASWRHRRACAWMFASSTTRGLSDSVTAQKFFRWSFNELGHRYRIAVALDKFDAPRWSWSDGDPGQLRSEVFGRLFLTCARFEDVAEKSGLKALVEDERLRADKDGSLPFWFMPAPLEGDMPANRKDHRPRLDIERHSIERLDLDDPMQAFVGAGNMAKLKLPRPALIAAVEERLKRVTSDQLVDADSQLQAYVPILVHFAGVTGSSAVADRLIELLIGLAPKADASLMNAIVHNVLECAHTPGLDRVPEDVFNRAMRRIVDAAAGPTAALQIEFLLREIINHRPPWAKKILPLIAASELAQ